MSKQLVMEFVTDEGKKSRLSIKDIKDDLDRETIEKTMEDIITQNLFLSNSGAFVKKSAAKIVDTNTEEFKFI